MQSRDAAGTRRRRVSTTAVRAHPHLPELRCELLADGPQELADCVPLLHSHLPPVASAVPIRKDDLERL